MTMLTIARTDRVDDAAVRVVGATVVIAQLVRIIGVFPTSSQGSSNAAVTGKPHGNLRACSRHEAQHRVKKGAAGQVAVSVRIYEVLGRLAIVDPTMRNLDLTARTDERSSHCVPGRGC